jgi:hypothetical protein
MNRQKAMDEVNDRIKVEAQEKKRGHGARNLTTHSTEARVSWSFIRED